MTPAPLWITPGSAISIWHEDMPDLKLEVICRLPIEVDPHFVAFSIATNRAVLRAKGTHLLISTSQVNLVPRI